MIYFVHNQTKGLIKIGGLDAFEHLGRAAHSEESWLALMPNAELKYSLNAVKRAGKILREGSSDIDELHKALTVFENWQECHSFPLNSFYLSTKWFAKEQSRVTNVVQRRKRLDAIIAKLKSNPNNQLTTMQDIAGVRAITKAIPELESLVARCREVWSNHHDLFDTDDYIAKPTLLGYRGIHLIYRFKSDHKTFNGRFVEIQFRTRLQHAWATAVEIADLFLREKLKAGKGDPNWQRFFVLMGSAIAMFEKTVQAPGTPTGRHGQELQEELRHIAELLRVEQRLEGWGSATQSINTDSNFTGMSGYSGFSGRSGYFVIELDENLSPTIQGYREDEVAKAYSYVATVEKTNPNVVLVRARDLTRLREAYPNWLIDTHNFLSVLRLTLKTEYW